MSTLPSWQLLRDWLHQRYERFWLTSTNGRRVLLGLLAFVIFSLLITAGSLGRQVHLNVNDVAPRDIIAPRDMVDRPRTEQLRQEAADRVQDVYRIVPEVGQEVQENLAATFQMVRQIRADYNAAVVEQSERAQGADGDATAEESTATPTSSLPLEEGLQRLKTALRYNLPDTTYQALLNADAGVINRLENELSNIVAEEMNKTIAERDLPASQQRVKEIVQTLNYTPALLDFASEAAVAHLKPNFFVDRELTEQYRVEARNQVQPVMIVQGEAIVRQNQRISADDMVRLRDAGILRDGSPLSVISGSIVLSALFIALLVAYLHRLRPEVYRDVNRLTLMLIILLGALLLSTALEPISPYLKPIGMVAVLVTILVDPITALIVSVMTGFLSSVMTGGQLNENLVLVAGGVSAVFGVLKVVQRSDIMRASAISAVVQMAMIFGMYLLHDAGPLTSRELWTDVMFGGLNGIVFAGFLSIGVLPYAESLFGVLTSMKLLELSNPNQPLLRKLLLEAPGTYHHSLMVANLAEAATEEVGGNALLVRVGAFYHDIGKMKRPYFFIENQRGGENPHDKISPNLSALIISTHVKEGLELARQHKLPQALHPFIAEHHGTTVIGYFYRKALEQAQNTPVEESDFRYPGPRPQSRETAILMLADSCEAAVRSMNTNDPVQIEMMIRKIVDDRLRDRQLDECDLNMRDLDRIVAVFTRVLTGVFHARVEYPEALIQQMEQGRKGGSTHSRFSERRKRA